jgi:sugar lactone lactonase YvrE
MKRISKTLLIAFTAVLIFSCKTEKKHEVKKEILKEVIKEQIIPNSYALKELALHPEGIVYSNATEKTYVGSYFKGKIVTVDLNGKMSDFITDETLVAVVGLTVDAKNNRLLVCNSDAGISKKSGKTTTGQLAQVIAYDLTTGKKMKTIDLSKLFPGGHFLNDLVLDAKGNIYVTDSFSPVIYKIDANDTPSILLSNDQFKVPQGTFGLNGIVYHKDNYLIVGRSFGGKIYKVALDNSKKVTEIKLDKNVNSLDGLLLTDANTLVLVSNYFAGPKFDEAIYKIETSDNWLTANVTSTFTALDGKYPTTLTEINDNLFVNFGYFPELVNPNSAPNDSFKLQKVKF